MRRLRFSIFDLMVLVALVAIDLVVLRLLEEARFKYHEFTELITLGILPMANVLALGMMRLIRARSGEDGIRRFWAGFGTFGGVALLLFLVCISFTSHSLHEVIDAWIRPLLNGGRPVIHIILPALLLPQLAFALFGGWMNSRFRVVISRRVDAATSIIDRPLT